MMFTITANVAYLSPIFARNFFSPTTASHIANNVVRAMVVIVKSGPTNMREHEIITMNDIHMLNGRMINQFVNFEYHFGRIWTSGVGLCKSDNIYPGAHNSAKPSGIEHMIFHGRMPMVRQRRYFKYMLVPYRPIIYNNNINDIINTNARDDFECVSSHIIFNNIQS